jgi:hypothetical protein
MWAGGVDVGLWWGVPEWAGPRYSVLNSGMRRADRQCAFRAAHGEREFKGTAAARREDSTQTQSSRGRADCGRPQGGRRSARMCLEASLAGGAKKRAAAANQAV